MAMLQMQRIYIYAMKKDRKHILELLQRRGVVEVEDMLPEDGMFHKTDVSAAVSGFEKNIASAKEAADIINKYAPEKKPMLSSLNGREEVPNEIYDAFSKKYEATLDTANRVLALSKEIAENNAEVLRLKTQADILTPWIPLDIPIDFEGTKYTKSFIGSLTNEWTLEDIYGKLADYMPISVEIISSSKEQTCIFVLSTKDNSESVYEALRSIDFAHPSVSFDRSPAEQLEYLKSQIVKAEEAVKHAEEEIISYAVKRKDLLFLQDYDAMRAEKYEVIGHLLQTKNVFIITGYIPERDAKELTEALNSQFVLAVELEQPSEDEDVPILLKNNPISEPVESVVTGFSLPGKGEIDPTAITSIFYYILFGIMLSDAGYGLIMVIGCGWALMKYKSMEQSTKNFLKMFFFCGISTIFWGIMFGSYFGDVVDVASEAFFNHKVTIPPLWFVPVNEPMKMLTFSMTFGLIHLLTGLIMRLIQLFRQKEYKAILYDAVSWFLLIVSLTELLISAEMFKGILGITFTIPAIVTKASIVVAAVSAVMIILTNGRESRNPFKRFLKGLYALYGITGYLSDVLSYSRLLALGLATGVISNVINKMAGMTAGMFLGPVFFIIIEVFGHALNIAINLLGSYVHTNRLHYVEFFGKFYSGGGRVFNPFHMNTKYYKVKEKM